MKKVSKINRKVNIFLSLMILFFCSFCCIPMDVFAAAPDNVYPSGFTIHYEKTINYNQPGYDVYVDLDPIDVSNWNLKNGNNVSVSGYISNVKVLRNGSNSSYHSVVFGFVPSSFYTSSSGNIDCNYGSGYSWNLSFNFVSNGVNLLPVRMGLCATGSTTDKSKNGTYTVSYDVCFSKFVNNDYTPPRPDNYLDFGTLTCSDLTIYQTSGSMKTVAMRRTLFLDEFFSASSLGSETSGYIGRIVHHFRSSDYDVGTRVYYDLAIEYNGTGAMLQDAHLLTASEENIDLFTRSTDTGYVLTVSGYSDITSSSVGFDVVVDVAYSGLPLGHIFTSNSDTLGGYSYPLEDENEIVKGFDDVTNGYQNNDMDSSKGELDSSLAGLDDAENGLFNPAKSQLDSYEFVDISATQGIVTGIGFVSTFLQSFYTSSGGLDGFGIITAVGFSVMLVSIVIGLYRHFTK